jgi:hypothetical protein
MFSSWPMNFERSLMNASRESTFASGNGCRADSSARCDEPFTSTYWSAGRGKARSNAACEIATPPSSWSSFGGA